MSCQDGAVIVVALTVGGFLAIEGIVRIVVLAARRFRS